MNAHDFGGGSRVSDVPVSCEMVSEVTSMLPRVAPAIWLQGLQQAVSSAPCDQGLRDAVLHVLRTVSDFLPETGLAVVLEFPAQPRLVVRIPEAEALPPQIFPEMAWERTEAIPVPWPAELHIAANSEPLPEDSPENLLLRELIPALAMVFRLVASAEQSQEIALLRKQVAQADKLAAVGKLAASTLHELNNPLTTILAYADFLRRKVERVPLEAEDVERLRRIAEAAEYVQRLTRNLVDYARPSGEVLRTHRLHEILEQALAFCEHPLREVGVLVEREYAESEDYVSGIWGELTQVFVNLIVNACHAMPRGRGRLLLRSERDGQVVQVTLRDNGHGVSSEHASRIFEPFYTTKALGSGTGLGLSIVKAIVEQHQGTISLRNPGENGAEFIIRLPLKRVQ